MSLEPCPYCGKPFKRLKSHLPHCKMSPGLKNSQVSKAALPASPKHTTQTESDKKTVNFSDKKLNESSSQEKPKPKMKAEMVRLGELAVATVLAGEEKSSDTRKPKSKWLAKREQEMAKQASLLTQKGSKFISNFQQEKRNCLSEPSQEHIKETPQTERKIAQGQNQRALEGTALTSLVRTSTSDITASDLFQLSQITDSQAEQIRQKHKKTKANVLEEIQNSPKALSKDPALAPRVTAQVHLSYFQTKTCVWDHIKHGLHNRRSGAVPVLYPFGATQEVSMSKFGDVSDLVNKPYTENQNVLSKASSIALKQTVVQRPVDSVRTSTSQGMGVMEWTPEKATGYGGKLVSASEPEISSNGGLLTKCRPSKIPPQSRDSVREQRLGDVRLRELAAWLGARKPKSPREAVTKLNEGWQWYYRKYINVQKGGIGGIAMLVAGYCVLSYMWSYPHLRKERWRKYH